MFVKRREFPRSTSTVNINVLRCSYRIIISRRWQEIVDAFKEEGISSVLVLM